MKTPFLGRLTPSLVASVFAGALLLGAAAWHGLQPAPKGEADPILQSRIDPSELALPEFTPEQLDSSPVGALLRPYSGPILLNPGFAVGAPGSTEPGTMQMSPGTQPPGWTFDTPLVLTGPVPADTDVRAAISKAVKYVLAQQNENGSWDIELTGTLMSQTADQAIDQIAATGLAGIALRYHVKADPERINAALEKASDFVMDRVYRGKLPMRIYYSNWRYTLGLKFLHMQWKACTDETRKTEYVSVARRMVIALLKMQLSNSDAPLLERKRKARVSSRFKNAALPSQVGLVLAIPTDTEYRGGARVDRIVAGSAAEKAGFRVGDKVIEAEGLKVENAVDFYSLEPEWVAGQKVRLKIKREGAIDFYRDVQLDQTWPGYLGLRVKQGTDGVEVEEFLPFCPCKDELAVGDVLNEVNGVAVATEAEYRAAEGGIGPAKKIRIKYTRMEKGKPKSKTVTVEAAAAPEGWFGFYISEEDKGDDNGVVVDPAPMPRSAAARAGIKEGDRITWIGDTPVLGLDHFADMLGTIPAGRVLTVKFVRDGAQQEVQMAADAVPQPPDLGFDYEIEFRGRGMAAVVKAVKKGHPAEKAGVKVGDVLTKINGVALGQRRPKPLMAGEEATFTFERAGKEVEFTYLMTKAEYAAEVAEEGGWAYYPDMGESPSFSTASAMLVLMDVEKEMKIRIPKTAMKAAATVIDKMRVVDDANGKQETYVYSPGALAAPPERGLADVRGCQGRNTICELTLVRYGTRKTPALKKMIEQWQKYRGELDVVRRLEFYNPPGKRGSPHCFDRWSNASYYWMYGHYYTLQAAKEVGGKTQKDINDLCVKAVMLTRHDDGTWVDHPSFGKTCGTCLALWVLGQCEGGFKDGYGSPTTQPDKNPETGR